MINNLKTAIKNNESIEKLEAIYGYITSGDHKEYGKFIDLINQLKKEA